jgi:hypothetical protein
VLLRGVVKGPDDKPVARAYVSAKTGDRWLPRGSAFSHEDGTFSFPVDPRVLPIRVEGQTIDDSAPRLQGFLDVVATPTEPVLIRLTTTPIEPTTSIRVIQVRPGDAK